MSTLRHSPGPAAAEAFKLGIATATTVALAGLWLLFWTDTLTPLITIFSMIMGLPIFLLLVSCLLSVWLGYNKDAFDVALS
jgi:hypothetical protein